MNTNDKGNKALGIAISYFCKKGYSVSIPLNDTQSYDLVIEIEGNLSKVDVKFTSRRWKSGTYYISTVTTGHNGYIKKEKDIDYWFVLTKNGSTYFIPDDDIKGQTFTVKDKYMVH